MDQQILTHFENLRIGLTQALGRGVFGDFNIAVQIKISMDAVYDYLKRSAEMQPDLAQPGNGIEQKTRPITFEIEPETKNKKS